MTISVLVGTAYVINLEMFKLVKDMLNSVLLRLLLNFEDESRLDRCLLSIIVNIRLSLIHLYRVRFNDS